MADDLSNILDGEIERVAGGFVFTEGPLWHPDGFLYFVDIRRSLILKWVPGQQADTFRENSGGANGMTFDLQGRMLMCEGDNRRVTRTAREGSISVVADSWNGKRLNRPNDIIGRTDGTIFFTDPQGRLPQEEREQGFSGVYLVTPDSQMRLATDECPYPNGLALSPDEATLYVAITRQDQECFQEKEGGGVCPHQRILAFDVAADGSLSNNRLFADMSSGEEGVPDGMKVDSEGNVFCTGPGGVWIFDKGGNHLGILRTPEVTANCAFGGSDRQTLFLTSSTSLNSIRVKAPGVRVPTAG
jgi:gluconolactonase